MMDIFINGEAYTLLGTTENTVANALDIFLQKSQAQATFAVALNGNFVGKHSYAATTLKPNDSLDVLFPIVGG